MPGDYLENDETSDEAAALGLDTGDDAEPIVLDVTIEDPEATEVADETPDR